LDWITTRRWFRTRASGTARRQRDLWV